MNSFRSLESVATHTVPEILQQPQSWRRLVAIVEASTSSLASFFASDPGGVIVLTGAGSSAYVGDALTPTLAAWTGRPVLSLANTDLVTHTDDLVPQGAGLCISFARSGNSPESEAAVARMVALRPRFRHLAITCNPDGALARAVTEAGGTALVMPPETNDVSLVMTSSFTTMYLAGLLVGCWDRRALWAREVEALASRAEVLLDRFGALATSWEPHRRSRLVYLGSGPHAGGIREMRLKMVEMSDGALVAQHESFLGLRHGPQVFVRPDTLVIAVLSSDPLVRAYELDLLTELQSKGQGREPLVLVSGDSPDPGLPPDAVVVPLGTGTGVSALGDRCPEAFQVPLAVAAGQILATVASVGLGLKPDAPSAAGTINRVVQGVRIYPVQGGLE